MHYVYIWTSRLCVEEIQADPTSFLDALSSAAASREVHVPDVHSASTRVQLRCHMYTTHKLHAQIWVQKDAKANLSVQGW